MAYASVCFRSSTSLIVDSSSSGPRDITGIAFPSSKAVYSMADWSIDCFLSLGTPSLFLSSGSYLSSGVGSLSLISVSDIASFLSSSSTISSSRPRSSSFFPILAAVFFFYFLAASAFFFSISLSDFFFCPPLDGSPSIFRSYVYGCNLWISNGFTRFSFSIQILASSCI